MKVNLHILAEDLSDLNLRGHLDDDPWTMRCTHAIGCTGAVETFEDDAIYLAESGMLPARPPRDGSAPSVICIGQPPEEWLLSRCNLLYIERDVGLMELFNRVSAAIAGYQSWEDDLVDILGKSTWDEELPGCAFRYIRNSFFLSLTEFQSFICSVPDDAEQTPLLAGYKEEFVKPERYYLPPEGISQYLSDEEYTSSAETTVPTLYSNRYYEYRTLYYNIRVDGATVGRIAFDEVVEPFTGRDFALIKVIGDLLAKSIDRKQLRIYAKPEDLGPVLHGLLAHELQPEERIAHLLGKLGWDMHDEYACLVLELRSREHTEDALRSLEMGIERRMPGTCGTVYDDSIVMVCNLRKMGKTAGQMLSDELPHLRDNLLMASLSSTYGDFRELYYYYRQAESALEAGLAEDPTRWAFDAEDYRMEFLLRKAGEGSTAGVLVPDGLKRLAENDRQKGTDYVGMLRGYLDNDRNIADTTRMIHVHRSTFLYRFQKVEAMLGMDLDDPDVRLYLQVALRLMEGTGGGSRTPRG